MQARIQALMTDAGIPGAGIVLIRDGQPIWVAGIGKADKATGRKVDADTRFRIGSITKSFLAIALLQEVERGNLSLDAKLSELAPEIPIDNPWHATDPVRVKHVLEHTAGFDDMHFRHVLPDPKARSTLEQMRQFAPEFRVRWRPGERMSYSNPGYGLAGYLLEKVSHRPMRDVIDSEVLAPLGMTNTVWQQSSAAPNLAVGHDRDSGKPVPWDEISMPGAGALISSATDMAKYVQFYLSHGASAPGVLSAANMKRMETVSTTLSARSGLTNGYGLANYGFERDGWNFRGHSGAIPGYLSSFGYRRDGGLGYVVLFNTLPGKNVGKIENQIVALITRGLEKPKPSAVLAPDPKWVGWYGQVNPRNQLTGGLEGLLNVGYLHIVDGKRYRLSHPLGLATQDVELLPGGLTRYPDKVQANGVFGMDASGRRVWISDDAFFIEQGLWATAAPLYVFTMAVLLMFAGVLFAPVWGYRLLRGKLREAPQRGLRWWPVAAILCLCAVVFAAVNLTDSMLMAPKPNLITLTMAIGTWLFAACGLIGLVQTLRHWSPRIHGFVRWYTLLASLSVVGLAVWMWNANLLGFRLWAW